MTTSKKTRTKEPPLPSMGVNYWFTPNRTCKPDAFKKPPVKYESLEFYGTSEFWYTMRDVLRIGGKYQDDGFEKAAKVCVRVCTCTYMCVCVHMRVCGYLHVL